MIFFVNLFSDEQIVKKKFMKPNWIAGLVSMYHIWLINNY